MSQRWKNTVYSASPTATLSVGRADLAGLGVDVRAGRVGLGGDGCRRGADADLVGLLSLASHGAREVGRIPRIGVRGGT